MTEPDDNSFDQQLGDFDATVSLTDCMQDYIQSESSLSEDDDDDDDDTDTDNTEQEKQEEEEATEEEEEEDDDTSSDDEEDIDEQDDLGFELIDEEYFDIIDIFYVRHSPSMD